MKEVGTPKKLMDAQVGTSGLGRSAYPSIRALLWPYWTVCLRLDAKGRNSDLARPAPTRSKMARPETTKAGSHSEKPALTWENIVGDTGIEPVTSSV